MMVSKKLGVICLFLCASVVFAQPEAGESCPPNSFLAGQDTGTGGGTYFYSDLEFCATPQQCRRVTAEDYPPPGEPPLTKPIECISWHGSYIDDTVNGCVKPAHLFRITFYPDDGTGKPDKDHPYKIYDDIVANARVVDTINWSGGGAGLKYQYWLTLPTPCDLASGHMAIVGKGAPDCWFLWGHSTQGNGHVYRWYETEGIVTIYTQNDVDYCFGEYIPGACCDDRSGNCNENSDDFTCFIEAKLGDDPPNGRFTTGTCADLDPLCGEIPGACCKADETCQENMLRQDCEDIGGAYWRGPQTICDDCCWIPDCPGGAHIEAEPCGDDTNPGCRENPPIMETIPSVGVVCGTMWAEGGEFDEDWYEFTMTQQFNLTIRNVNTQIPIRLTPHFNEFGGPPACDDLWYYVDTLYEPCVPKADFTPPLFPKGTYWIHVSPEDADGPVNDFYPCGTANEYYFEIEAAPVECPNPCADIPGAPFHYDEEPDYCANPAPDTYNSGCDASTPPGPFLPITDDGWLYCAASGFYELNLVCRGDLNCDDQIDFADINPFVLILTNPAGWQAQYPDCPMDNGDINGDDEINFGDINPFVALLSSGGGQPIPCFQSRDLVPDTDWYEFKVVSAAKTASIFAYSEFPLNWEIYSAAAGCGAPPMERHYVSPCLSVSTKTFCLDPGTYWLRIDPDTGVDCGKEYALGLEEFISCEPCSVDCEPTDTPEGEPCGEHQNDTCDTQAMVVPDPVWANQSVICGTIYNTLDPDDEDVDWYKFDIPQGDNQYLIVVLNSDMPVTPWMTIQGCSGSGWLTEDGIHCDPLGELNGFFVDKQDVPGGSHVDLEITTNLWNPSSGWYDNPGHFPCDQTYRMIVGYSPTEPTDGDFGVAHFRKLELTAPGPHAVAKWQQD